MLPAVIVGDNAGIKIISCGGSSIKRIKRIKRINRVKSLNYGFTGFAGECPRILGNSIEIFKSN